MSRAFEDILASLPQFESTARQMKETLLADLAMVGEIPAPTSQEKERSEFLRDRFEQTHITQHSIDEMDNSVGFIEGKADKGNILVVAHEDTVFDRSFDHTVQVQPNKITGPGVADNSLGVSFLASLPLLLRELDITFHHNMILVGATRSLGRGDLEGLHFFLDNFNHPISAGIVVEGVELGRLSHLSIGMRRGEITCRIPEQYDWTRYGEESAILTMNEIINRINTIRIPRRPRTSIILGSMRGGRSFSTAKKATLRFEIRSDSSDMVQEIEQKIHAIIEQATTRTGDSIELQIFAQRQPGGLSFSHPLVQRTSQIIKSLDIEPQPGPSTSELSAFIAHQIPAITLGLTHGNNVRQAKESIEIEPLFKGVAQVIATLKAIDQGYYDET